jgi:hypothetical protein
MVIWSIKIHAAFVTNSYSGTDKLKTQDIVNSLPAFYYLAVQKPLEEMRSSSSVTTGLEKHIDHLAILVNSPPQYCCLPSIFTNTSSM